MIELTPFGRSDFERLIEWIPTAEFLMQWTGYVFTFPLTFDQLENHVGYAETNPDRRKIWNAVYGKEVVGHIELGNIWEPDRKASLNRVIIDPHQRRQGFGKEMVQQVLQYAFEKLTIHRVELGVWDFNTQAIRCYESCGFVREGVQRDYRRMDHVWWNNVQMSILEHEWRALPQKNNRRWTFAPYSYHVNWPESRVW